MVLPLDIRPIVDDALLTLESALNRLPHFITFSLVNLPMAPLLEGFEPIFLAAFIIVVLKVAVHSEESLPFLLAELV